MAELDREYFKKELEGFSKKEKLAFAYRSALRVLPMLGKEGTFKCWEEEDRKKHIFSLLFALNYLHRRLYINDLPSKKITYAGDAYAATGNVIDAVTTADIYATAATSYAADDDSEAVFYAVLSQNYNKIEITIFTEELNTLKDSNSIEGFLNRPLWRNAPQEYLEIVKNFKKALYDLGLGYWANYFDDAFRGELDLKQVEDIANIDESIKKDPKKATDHLATLLHRKLKRLNEVKVVFLGEGKAGKTSVIRKIFNEELPEQEKSTIEVKIRKKEYHHRNTVGHFWDFGGQVIMHSTHQYFLSSRCIYVIVLDGRREEQPEYWLEHVKNFGGNSPVLIVRNKVDEGHNNEIPFDDLKGKYPNISNMYQTSCTENIGIEEFLEDLEVEIERVKAWNSNLPAEWFNLKESLEKRSDDYITKEEYKRVCKENKVKEEEYEKLLTYLDDLGIILNYEKLGKYETLVFKPEWLTFGTYRVIADQTTQDKFGRVNKKDLERILLHKECENKYCKENFDFLLEVICQFELGFFIDDNTKDEILIPSVLQNSSIKHNFPIKESLHFRYKFEFLPTSIMGRFIVRQHKIIDDSKYWRHGVVLKKDNVQALIVEDSYSKTIDIWVNGDAIQQRNFLGEIRNTFKKIIDTFSDKFEYNRIVILNEDILINYDELLVMKQSNEKTHFVPELRGRLNVDETLAPFGIDEEINMKNFMVHGDLIINKTTTVNIEIKNQALELQEILTELKDSIKDKEAIQDLERLQTSIDRLEKAQTPEDIKKSGIGRKIGKFFENLNNSTGEAKKVYENVKGAYDNLKDLGNAFNNIAGKYPDLLTKIPEACLNF